MNRDIIPGIIVFICGLIGVVIAVIEKVLYDNGILIDTYVQGSLSLPDLQILTIIVWLIFGIVLGVAKS